MLVEINLLPHKEPKKINLIITLSSLLGLFLLVGGFYLMQINSTKNNVAAVDRQISMTQKIANKEQQKTVTAESSNSVSQLKSAIEWANSYRIPTIPVMRHLTSLLPERGFIQSFGYTEAGAVTLTVQFDSAREAAYFLESLNESKWIQEASLNSLTTTETNTASSTTAVSNNQTTTTTTSTTSGTNTQTNPTGTTSEMKNQTNSTGPSADTNSQNNTAASNSGDSHQNTTVVNSNTQTNGTTAANGESSQNGPNNTTANTTNSSSTDAKTNSTAKSQYLPRYTGQFEIKLNQDTIKEILKKSKKDEKGVAGS